MNYPNPSAIFSFFHRICQIPHESGNEKGMILFLQEFAKERHLDCKTDAAGNVVISKPGTPGKEHHPTVVLQSHLDMVCEKNEDVEFDFTKDPIQYYIEDGWLKARGTTLGADDGIGVATQMALLESNEVVHPPLECLFTVEEETGLTGARALQPGFITGNLLINLDSEDEGELFFGCAGGVDTTARFAYKKEDVPPQTMALKITVGGGVGGHSGDDINKERANAIQLLARLLWELRDEDLRIARFTGGNKRNAIAREAFAVCVGPASLAPKVEEAVQRLLSQWVVEYKHTEPHLFCTATPCPLPDFVIDADTSRHLVQALLSCPHGPLAMSLEVPGLVETSTNLASVKMDQDGIIRVGTSQRSSINSARFTAAARIESLFTLAGATVTHEGEYPGWAPNLNSPLVKIGQQAYRHLYQKEVKVKAIHAGLECGLFLEKFPDLDMISIGPTLRAVHAPGERLEIATVTLFWDYLLEILNRL